MDNLKGGLTVPRDLASTNFPLILTTSHKGRQCYPNSEIRNGLKEIKLIFNDPDKFFKQQSWILAQLCKTNTKRQYL